MNPSQPEASDRQGPPWIQPEIQQQIEWRNGDVIISVPAKSGTTWTMNIVHQLFAGGSADFDDIYAEVPWIEFISHPEQPQQEVVDRVAAMPTTRPRAFKTHSAPPTLPFIKAGSGPDLKYIVVFRNPEEALVSFRPFFDQHADEWYQMWDLPKAALCRDDFPSFYYEVVNKAQMQGMFFGFLADWWPLRTEKNVLFLHYNDMKRDHEATLKKIADFLGIEPTAEQWQAIATYTSFPWMKQHEEKFEARTAGLVPILKSGAMIRKGESGKAKSEGMTEEIAKHLREVGSQICNDPVALDWYYNGGDLP
ncbi:sulfotransferase domain-containing protein [Halioxenophilus sp. WMMB6]|uniref:sulfotransferase domain-containing protein n=1 Tax=Halioxenophilus sp. WMMB6 TaxID=3073815 RepID=UPI00295E8EA1|nr:sulfotransferase domain-containing protein [Halioxenophilus sp. WMMB6]